MRYRLTLTSDDLLELAERAELLAGEIVVTKYRHHWQDKTGRLIKRWDNAPHHKGLTTYPDHLHDGAEDSIVTHPPISALQVLDLVLASSQARNNATEPKLT